MTTSNSNASTRVTPPVPAVSVVIPVYNESSRIGRSLETVLGFFEALGETFEVIVVDDGSSDATVAVAHSHARNRTEVSIMEEPHRGKASAVLAGMTAARGDIVGFMDVDLATPLETWRACRLAIDGGAGVAIGSREGSGAARVGEPQYRHIMGRVFNGIVRTLLLPGIHDTQCGFKFFSRAALDDILPRQHLYRDADEVRSPRVTAFDVELLFIARALGYEIAVIPVTWEYGDHSKVNPITDTIQNLQDVLQVRLNGWLGRYR